MANNLPEPVEGKRVVRILAPVSSLLVPDKPMPLEKVGNINV